MNSGVKFGRNYSLTATSLKFALPIQFGSPFTLEFDITRSSYSSSNVAQLRLYNLSSYYRNLLTHDQNDPAQSTAIQVTLNAGYGPGPYWPIVFKGNTTRAYSVRQGVNFITVLECFDGGLAYANAYTTRQFSAGQDILQVYDALISDLAPFGVSTGAVSTYLGTLARGVSFSGNTIDILRELSNGNFFIDNLAANVLSQSDAIGGDSVVINAASGLLGTPIKENQILRFSILFEPRIVIGTLVNLQSITASNVYNGPHKVVSVHHRGMISAAVSGDAITELEVQSGIFNTIMSEAGI